MYASSVSVTYMKSGGCRLRWRRALSSIKKGVFLDVEGHVLEWRRACSWMGKDMLLKGVRQGGEASVAVRFCEIGWLDVSVECCVFCSSVLSVRKRTFAKLAGEFFSHRTHRFNRTFPPTFRTHRRPPAYRIHRGLSTKISCNVLWYRLTWCLCEPLCVLFFCVFLWEIERTLWLR